MDETDFEALNEHLQEVRPIFDAFCASHDFVYVDRRALGRYPRIRIEKTTALKTWFDLWMECDKNGRRFERFSRDVPYELSAGVYVDVQDGSKYGIRFQKAILCFSGKPFRQVGPVLRTEMDRCLKKLEQWDVECLKDDGTKVQLGI